MTRLIGDRHMPRLETRRVRSGEQDDPVDESHAPANARGERQSGDLLAALRRIRRREFGLVDRGTDCDRDWTRGSRLGRSWFGWRDGGGFLDRLCLDGRDKR